MATKEWHYAIVGMQYHGLMKCNVCGKRIIDGQYRYRETDDAFITQHESCSESDPNWHRRSIAQAKLHDSEPLPCPCPCPCPICEDVCLSFLNLQEEFDAYLAGGCHPPGSDEIIRTIRAAIANGTRRHVEPEKLIGNSRRVDLTAPERIWLQVDAGSVLQDDGQAFPRDHEGISWCAEKIGGIEIEYVRVDLTWHRVTMPDDVREVLLITDGERSDKSCSYVHVKPDEYDTIRAFVRKVTGE